MIKHSQKLFKVGEGWHLVGDRTRKVARVGPWRRGTVWDRKAGWAVGGLDTDIEGVSLLWQINF